MNNTWKYKIELSDPSVFDEIESERDVSFPHELKDFIVQTNAATPSRYNFMVGNNERVLGAVLSFNHNEKDADTVFTALTVVSDKDLIPFGIDPFGNYICYDIKTVKIVFWDHETNTITIVANSLNDFLTALY